MFLSKCNLKCLYLFNVLLSLFDVVPFPVLAFNLPLGTKIWIRITVVLFLSKLESWMTAEFHLELMQFSGGVFYR